MTYFYVISAVLNAKSTAIPPKQQGFVINSVYNMSMSVSHHISRAVSSTNLLHYSLVSTIYYIAYVLFLFLLFVFAFLGILKQ